MRKRIALNQYTERSGEGLLEFVQFMNRNAEAPSRKRRREKQKRDESEQLGVDVLDVWGEWRPFNVSTTRCPPEARVMAFEDDVLARLSDEQRQAVRLIEAGISVFVTGPGGTGKSEIISAVKEAGTRSGLKVHVTASTGIAARNVGGITLHRFAGVGLRPEKFMETWLDRVGTADNRIGCWRECDVLIIDEISMVDPKFMDNLDHIAKAARLKAPAITPQLNSQPFGGIQLIFLGDFAQLTISETIPLGLLKHVPFVVELRTIFRQTDPRFRLLLNNIRLGKKVRGDLFELHTRTRTAFSSASADRVADSPSPSPPPPPPPDLSAFRKIVHNLNHKQMAGMIGSAAGGVSARDHIRTYKMEIQTEHTNHPEIKVAPAEIGWEEETLTLCIGSRVLLTKNLDQGRGLVNGSMGKVVAFDEQDRPVVAWDSGGTTDDGSGSAVPLVTQEFEVKRTKVKITYLPLLCAWAITVHRAQGMTLAKARIHVKSMKGPALLYTALSRVRTLEGIEIVGDIEEENIVANPGAVAFYQRLQELVDSQATETDGLAVLPTGVVACDDL
jgi:ATP-dependent DNA helicase PIF1